MPHWPHWPAGQPVTDAADALGARLARSAPASVCSASRPPFRFRVPFSQTLGRSPGCLASDCLAPDYPSLGVTAELSSAICCAADRCRSYKNKHDGYRSPRRQWSSHMSVAPTTQANVHQPRRSQGAVLPRTAPARCCLCEGWRLGEQANWRSRATTALDQFLASCRVEAA
ncbi:hypothetical protein B0H67DRAFT_315222 [Lasiosphaeris hirsuta]|uniref:Uncharacterized protein n=1 Tax=Lasiosphaeris hirsuta TaxID=260670 RepID=A0AA40A1F9_9PEZI|nr:hypothetical protein B0H67DRAFT_315222 [Lasiosphaeris hirsuta]